MSYTLQIDGVSSGLQEKYDFKWFHDVGKAERYTSVADFATEWINIRNARS